MLGPRGGGGKGENLIDWVLSAYESDPRLPHPALLVFGPFMQPEQQAGFQQRVARLRRGKAITLHARIPTPIERAARGVAIGGYKKICEILSLAKHALI